MSMTLDEAVQTLPTGAPDTLPISSRPALGARWLDEHKPGWYRQIDLRILDIGDDSSCVLAQLIFGCCFGCRVFQLGLNKESAVALGFVIFDVGDMHEAYAVLTAAWVAEITARREGVEL